MMALILAKTEKCTKTIKALAIKKLKSVKTPYQLQSVAGAMKCAFFTVRLVCLVTEWFYHHKSTTSDINSYVTCLFLSIERDVYVFVELLLVVLIG